MIAIEINVKQDLRGRLSRLSAAIEPARLAAVAGRTGRNVVRSHLFALNASRPNQLGGKRTNFYTGAGRATQFTVQGDTAVISINQVGIRQRFYGGTIRPKTRKYLTIPVHPDAHGKRASEFKGLIVIFGQEGQPVALARPRFRPRKRGFVGPPVAEIGDVLFRLVRKVTQKPDPAVLPLPDQLYGPIISEINTSIDRATGGNGGPS